MLRFRKPGKRTMPMRIVPYGPALVGSMLFLLSSHAGAQQKITIDGSTGTAPLIAALGSAFTAKSGIVVEIGKGLGTNARLEALAAERIDIAMASHGLKIDEIRRRGMTVHLVAKTPVVFAAHESAKVAGLTAAQVCAIYQGSPGNWKDLGGGDLAIVAHARPDSEVDSEVVRDGIMCLKDMKLPSSVRIMERSGDMARSLAATAGAFGVTSATVVQQSQGKIASIALDGIAPSEANVAAGTYRLSRDSFLITRNNPSSAVQSFIAFVTSPDGAAVMRSNGAIAAAR
jgi:phosphate transport system substrate-binding protein